MNFQPKHFPALAIKTETKHSIDRPVCSKDRAFDVSPSVEFTASQQTPSEEQRKWSVHKLGHPLKDWD